MSLVKMYLKHLTLFPLLISRTLLSDKKSQRRHTPKYSYHERKRLDQAPHRRLHHHAGHIRQWAANLHTLQGGDSKPLYRLVQMLGSLQAARYPTRPSKFSLVDDA